MKKKIKAYDFLVPLNEEPSTSMSTPKKKSVTNELTNKIVDHINESPFSYCIRVNSQGQYREDLGKWTFSGSTSGCSDLIAIHLGKIYCLEIKGTKGDRQRDKQVKFQAKVEAAMGKYFLIDSFEKFKFIWESLTGNK
jgi:hypothetical protein